MSTGEYKQLMDISYSCDNIYIFFFSFLFYEGTFSFYKSIWQLFLLGFIFCAMILYYHGYANAPIHFWKTIISLLNWDIIYYYCVCPNSCYDLVEVTFTTTSFLLKQKLFCLTRLEVNYVVVTEKNPMKIHAKSLYVKNS